MKGTQSPFKMLFRYVSLQMCHKIKCAWFKILVSCQQGTVMHSFDYVYIFFEYVYYCS